MLRTRSDRLALLALGIAAGVAAAQPAFALSARVDARPLGVRLDTGPWIRPAPPQAPSAAGARRAAQPATPGRIVGSQINVSRQDAVLQLGFADGRQLEFAVRDGRMFADGRDLGAAPRGSSGERAWRDLLKRAMDAPTPQLAGLFQSWSAPGTDQPLKDALVAAMAGQAPVAAATPAPAPLADSFNKVQNQLEQMRDSMQSLREQLQSRREAARDRAEEGSWAGPFRYIWRGFTGIVGTLVMFVVLFGLGVATVFFGGRPYLEAVADTARRHTARSWVVGLAASFLALPAYILGALALVISIIGIPALLVWIPLFPVAVIVAAFFGYLGVAHGAGEALAERRLYGGDWFRRGNSYYFLLTGLGVLLSLFFAAHVVEMAGPWVSFIRGMLMFLAVIATWFAFTTGLGAVLLTRGGTRPLTGMAPLDMESPSVFEEESRV